ncbi:protein gar2 isoform X1 [Amborella trichopoda]|uniref:protein gar2 isoform X1 n=1 Tax=Amborella trichopoda TaxID=13333 RepID=UPI0009BCC343|nr:protein gar2 isoform X1 [Amborella trichopoda]|eukprot:XP_020523100.1 protein gar2 isoform X1 [Amborella trichopoda]
MPPRRVVGASSYASIASAKSTPKTSARKTTPKTAIKTASRASETTKNSSETDIESASKIVIEVSEPAIEDKLGTAAKASETTNKAYSETTIKSPEAAVKSSLEASETVSKSPETAVKSTTETTPIAYETTSKVSETTIRAPETIAKASVANTETTTKTTKKKIIKTIVKVRRKKVSPSSNLSSTQEASTTTAAPETTEEPQNVESVEPDSTRVSVPEDHRRAFSEIKEDKPVENLRRDKKLNEEEKPVENLKGDEKFEENAVDTEKSMGIGIELAGKSEVSERRKKKKTEIFIGGLDRDATEQDIRKVFEKVGEIVELRLMMDGETGRNKGYAFCRYSNAAEAKRAVTELARVEVRGKQCGTAAMEDNDTIFLGNIDKKWKKDDIIKLLNEAGIRNISMVKVMNDLNNSDMNRGFAFLELETNKDALNAFKILQKKDVFGQDRNIKVSWADPLNDPDEEEMLKVKSVYAEGIPSSWEEDKVRKHFMKYGEISRVVLARNIYSARRKDFAFVNFTTREAALACIEAFPKDEIFDEGSKVNIKVSLAKPVPKGKPKSTNEEQAKPKPKASQQRPGYTQSNPPSSKGKFVSRGSNLNSGSHTNSSTTDEILKVLREQASWRRDPLSADRVSSVQDYRDTLLGAKRPLPALGEDLYSSDLRGHPRTRLDSMYPTGSSSYGASMHGTPPGASPMQFYGMPPARYAEGRFYAGGAADSSRGFEKSCIHQTPPALWLMILFCRICMDMGLLMVAYPTQDIDILKNAAFGFLAKKEVICFYSNGTNLKSKKKRLGIPTPPRIKVGVCLIWKRCRRGAAFFYSFPQF